MGSRGKCGPEWESGSEADSEGWTPSARKVSKVTLELLGLATDGPDLRLGSTGLPCGPSASVSSRGAGLAEKGGEF